MDAKEIPTPERWSELVRTSMLHIASLVAVEQSASTVGRRLKEKSSIRPELPEFNVNISYFEGRKHLPIVEIKKAA